MERAREEPGEAISANLRNVEPQAFLVSNAPTDGGTSQIGGDQPPFPPNRLTWIVRANKNVDKIFISKCLADESIVLFQIL